MLEAGETVREMTVEVSDGTALPIVAQGDLGAAVPKDLSLIHIYSIPFA